MMDKWKSGTISDLGTVVGGATPSTKNTENYDCGTIAWITPKDLAGFSGRFISHGARNITEQGLKSCSTQLMPAHTVLFSSRAPIGYVAIAEQEICTNQGFKSVVPNKNTDYMFLYYLLKYSRDKIENLGSGTTFKEVSGSTMRGIEVSFPETLEEQRQIASVLSVLDDKIEKNAEINDNLQQQAFALFDQLMLESGDSKCLVSEVAYLNPKRQLSKNQVARCIDMSQLSTSGAFPSGWDMKPFNGGMRFINGDTLLARITPCLENGKTAYIDFLDEKEVAFGSTEYIVLAPREGVPPEYLYCLARYPAFVDYAVKNMNGSSGRQRVSADTIGKFVMNHPSKDALRNFGDIAAALFMKMRYNSFENLRLASFRDAILPRLMSGELDVSALDL